MDQGGSIFLWGQNWGENLKVKSIPPPPKMRGFRLPVNRVICGSNIEVVTPWPADCINSIVTDPPYGLGFMGKEWDTLIEKTRDSAGGFLRNGKSGSNPYAAARCRHGSDSYQMQEWYYQWAKAMLRITKPGGFLFCFGGTRTFHRLTCAIEDAGWEIRDCMMWLYGSGFPKSHNISKALDKKVGAKREKIGESTNKIHFENLGQAGYKEKWDITAPATPLAQLWNGYGTALKPAWEPIIVAMKPKEGSFADNAEKYGVAGLNIDGGRIPANQNDRFGGGGLNSPHQGFMANTKNTYKKGTGFRDDTQKGRWPANLILTHHPECWADDSGKISCHSDCPVRMLDEQTGTKKSGFMAAGTKRLMSDNPNKNTYGKFKPDKVKNDTYGDSGSASRFFYCAKTSRKERNMGLEDVPEQITDDGRKKKIDNPYLRGKTPRHNNHPTVKPLALMKYLCTLLKMPGQNQIILDPFGGSGTTGMACKELGINYIIVEKEQEYCDISIKRIAAIKPCPN